MNHPRFRIFVLIILLVLLQAFRLMAQQHHSVPSVHRASGKFNKPIIGIEANGIVSAGDHVPFWLISNKYGLFSAQQNQLVARVNAAALPRQGKNVDYYYGIDAAVITDGKTRFIPSQAYLGIKFFDFNLYGGMKNEHTGTQDSALSLGGFLYSGNSRAYPRIAIRTNDYIFVPLTKQWIETKFGFSHAWMGDSMQYVSGAYLQDKYFYLKLKIISSVKIYAGLHHVAIWGGNSPDTALGKLPDGLKDFLNVFFANRGDKGPESTLGHREGDHIASYHFGADFSNDKISVNLYWQTMLEDKNGRVGVDWQNKVDGLWGLAYCSKRKESWFKKLVLEYFNSTDQSGNNPGSGGDNYYNHWIYKSGWTNFGMVNGSPVITSPVFYNMDPITMINNRVRAFHIGAATQFGTVYISGKATFTLNYGTDNYPTTVHTTELYSCLDVHYKPAKLKDTEFVGSLGLDFGDWLGNNYGMLITYRKFFRL